MEDGYCRQGLRFIYYSLTGIQCMCSWCTTLDPCLDACLWSLLYTFTPNGKKHVQDDCLLLLHMATVYALFHTDLINHLGNIFHKCHFVTNSYSATCSNPCQNGGTCSSPNTCTCDVGWMGMQCETRKISSNVYTMSWHCG